MKASSVVRPATVGGIAGFLLLTMSSNVFGASVAQLSSHAAPTTPSACAKRPKSAVLAAAVDPSASATDSSGTATPAATPTVSESTVASPPTSAGPIATPTVTASQAPPPTTTSDPPSSTPTGTPTPTPSPTPSPSPSGTSPSPSPSPGQPQLCVQVQSLSGSPQVKAGQTAGFVVWVWSTGGASSSVTVAAKVATAKNIGAPKFTVCPQASGATCTLGTLPASQADELQATSAVAPHATSTEHVALTATATGKNASSGTATASLAVTAGTPAGTTSPPGAGGEGLPTEPVPPLSVIPDPVGGVGNPAGLFPTVAPSTSSPAIGFPPARKQAGHSSSAETASSIVPLDPRLIGGQLAGLAVLAGAVAIALARLSLRRSRPQDGPPDQRDDD